MSEIYSLIPDSYRLGPLYLILASFTRARYRRRMYRAKDVRGS